MVPPALQKSSVFLELGLLHLGALRQIQQRIETSPLEPVRASNILPTSKIPGLKLLQFIRPKGYKNDPRKMCGHHKNNRRQFHPHLNRRDDILPPLPRDYSPLGIHPGDKEPRGQDVSHHRPLQHHLRDRRVPHEEAAQEAGVEEHGRSLPK